MVRVGVGGVPRVAVVVWRGVRRGAVGLEGLVLGELVAVMPGVRVGVP